jgi:uncharacterized protein YndB with AHSA1/START domain
MTTSSVIHDTFVVARGFPAAPARVFAAFASREAKDAWGDTGDLEPAPGDAGIEEFDFRPGGREQFGLSFEGTVIRYRATYYDIVPDRRIVYAYEMYADDERMSVSVATIEIVPDGGGSSLTWTEQGTYLDGIDGDQAPTLRRGGTAEMLDGLTRYLAADPA